MIRAYHACHARFLSRATGRFAGLLFGGLPFPGFAALTPGFMPPSAPRTCSEFPKSFLTFIVETDHYLDARLLPS
jgi:hypothetical protein